MAAITVLRTLSKNLDFVSFFHNPNLLAPSGIADRISTSALTKSGQIFQVLAYPLVAATACVFPLRGD